MLATDVSLPLSGPIVVATSLPPPPAVMRPCAVSNVSRVTEEPSAILNGVDAVGETKKSPARCGTSAAPSLCGVLDAGAVAPPRNPLGSATLNVVHAVRIRTKRARSVVFMGLRQVPGGVGAAVLEREPAVPEERGGHGVARALVL